MIDRSSKTVLCPLPLVDELLHGQSQANLVHLHEEFVPSAIQDR